MCLTSELRIETVIPTINSHVKNQLPAQLPKAFN